MKSIGAISDKFLTSCLDIIRHPLPISSKMENLANISEPRVSHLEKKDSSIHFPIGVHN